MMRFLLGKEVIRLSFFVVRKDNYERRITKNPFILSLVSRVQVLKTLLFVCALLTGTALAHANLESSTPEDGSTVKSLGPVSLTFTENVQVPFSFFKVYKLADEGSLEDSQEKLKLNGLAGQLLSSITEDNAAAERADDALLTSAKTSNVIELGLKRDLTPGIYALMWRVLSVDTHVTQGFILFNYQP